MSTITLQNFRVGSDLTVKVRLKDGGVAIDWSTLSGIRAVLYSDAQSSIAGRCDVTVDGEDPTLLVCRYAATKMQYLGVNRIVVSAKYMGMTKTYDKPAFTFVRWTEDQAGEEITIEDPEVTVEIDVEDVSSSILQEAVDAAFSAADRANEAAEAAEHMVDIHTGPKGDKGDTGETPDISIGTVTTVEPGTPAAASMTGTPEAPVLNLSIPKGLVGATPNFTVGTVTTGEPGSSVIVTITGTPEAPVLNLTIPQGMQGNTGSSVEYPYELVNNLTTDDATKGLSAAQGKVLDGKVSQLEAKVTDFAQVVTVTKTVIPNLEEGKTIYYRFSCADHNIGCIGFFDANNAQIGSWIGNTSGANLAQNYEGTIAVPSGASYLKAYTASPGFAIDALYYTDSVIDTIHEGLDKKLDKGVGKNIFDNVLIPGTILSTGKTTTTGSDNFSYTKNFLPVLPNTQYSATRANGGAVATSANAIVLFYDKNKNLLGTSSLNGITTFTTLADTAFIRLNVYNDYNEEIQIEVGNARTEYEPYSAISKYLTGLPNASVGINTINDSAKDAEPIRTSVKLPLSGGIVTYGERNYVPFGCKNIYDNVLEPGFFNPNGTVSSSTTVSHTVNYLPVKPETEYIATKADGTGIAPGAMQMVFYNKAKAVISAIPLGGVTTFTTPAGCYYIRTSVYNSYNNKVQIELGNTRTTYEPYNPIYKYLRPYEVAQTKSLLGTSRVSASADTLEANTPLELTDFPKFSHARTGITAIAYFTNFTDMSVGNNREGGVAVKVDNTNVYFLVDPNSETENAWETFAHGLTISTFLKVEIYVTKFGTVKVILFTNGGIKVINTSVNYGFNYTIMVKSSADIERVTISAVCGAFRCPVWALGDSYFGESIARVGYQMRELGFKDLYWSYLSGGHGYNLEPDFELALNFGTPKFVVWAIGQNDADSDTAISATWLQHTEKLLALCVEKGITPILCTIPNVPGSGALRNHSFKNAWVKASGHRYIDTEAAVGAQADGTWYPGMLSSDNIHPSVLGAQAIATQWLIDFPEVMEYGLLDEELPTE